MDRLEFTGERLIPGIHGELVNEHLHRYAFTFEYTRGKKVLDIACGEGYGANLISDIAEFVAGVDVDDTVINYASKKYQKSNLEFNVGLAERIPYDDCFFDVVVSFETIEHLVLQSEMMSEIYRVLKEDGVLVISSPEKSVYSDSRDYENVFHEKELYADEFIELVKGFFRHVSVYGQKSLNSSLIFPLEIHPNDIAYWEGDFDSVNLGGALQPKFIIIVASKMELNFGKSKLSFFSNNTFNLPYSGGKELEIIRNSLRYRFANLLFWPWDLIKRLKRIGK